jgi:hypothetical protein
MKLLCAIPLLFLLSGCSSEDETPPDNIINSSKMVYIMMDIHIVDAAINMNNETPRGVVLNKPELYAAVYKKYRVRKTQFDSSFTYYARHPEKMQEIYDDLLIRLSEKQASIDNAKPAVP